MEVYPTSLLRNEKKVLEDWIDYFSKISFPHYALEEEKAEAKAVASKEVNSWFFPAEGAVVNHFSPRYEVVLEKGFSGIIKEAKEKLKGLENTTEELANTLNDVLFLGEIIA